LARLRRRFSWSSFRHGGIAVIALPLSVWKAMWEGALNNLTNPKPLLFMFAFLPKFVDPTRGRQTPRRASRR